MPYNSPNPGTGADENYFNDGPQSEPQDKQKEGTEETGLLPKSLMAGKNFKVGEEIVLKITAIHEKDFEVEYSHDESKEEKGGESGDEGGEMAGMGGGGGGGMEEMY
jgi:hypothetical protein